MARSNDWTKGRTLDPDGSMATRANAPTWRKLRIFSYDPSLASQHASMDASVVTLNVPWEVVRPGPEGEYLQIVDIDPPSQCAYAPADLDDPYCLATDGFEPSESNPLFHQQMVYAVAMSTIGHFERALGRVALWSDYDMRSPDKKRDALAPKNYSFVRRLRIYPHALRDQNAYYSSAKKAVLFGYFPVEKSSVKSIPGTLVFTCLSHDIIAHEVTHALLDGVHHYFSEPVNGDVLAFHEAFADIVAIFQHFSYPGVLRSQVAKTRGNLEQESFLGQLAQQFGDATGRGDALRSYLGGRDSKTGKWKPRQPDPSLLGKTREPHARGGILVAAVFGAFTKVYNRRTADLYRLASDGSGVLRPGDIHPDLVDRLADEAQKVADYMLQMCIRAMDYCPPAGITFGDFLRGAITGDYDYFPDDRYGYRVALIESFRQWGIFPIGMRSMSIESLLWPSGKEAILDAAIGAPGAPHDFKGENTHAGRAETALKGFLKQIFSNDNFSASVNEPEKRSGRADFSSENGSGENEALDVINSESGQKSKKDAGNEDRKHDDRLAVWRDAKQKGQKIHQWIFDIAQRKKEKSTIKLIGSALGFIVHPDEKEKALRPRLSIRRAESKNPDPEKQDLYRLQINSVRTATRRDRVRSWPRTDFVLEIVQTRDGYFDEKIQKEIDDGRLKPEKTEDHQKPDFKYRAGCTLIIDPVSLNIRRVIKTPFRVDDEGAFTALRNFIVNGMDHENAFALGRSAFGLKEPFAVLHSHEGHDNHGW